MIWDKIWKSKDKPDDSNDYSLKGSYSVCEGISNSPSYTHAEGNCMSYDDYYASTKWGYIKRYSTFDTLSPLRWINKNKIEVLNNFISYLSIKYPLDIKAEVSPLDEAIYFIMSTSLSDKKVGFKVTYDSSLCDIGMLIINVYEKGVTPTAYMNYEKNRKNEIPISDNPQAHYCTSCGAALKRNSHKCEYCDTEYW